MVFNHFVSIPKLRGLRGGRKERRHIRTVSKPLSPEAWSIPGKPDPSPEKPSLPPTPRGGHRGHVAAAGGGSGRLCGRHLEDSEAGRAELRARASLPLPSPSLAPASVLLPTFLGSCGRSLSGGAGNPGGGGGVSDACSRPPTASRGGALGRAPGATRGRGEGAAPAAEAARSGRGGGGCSCGGALRACV